MAASMVLQVVVSPLLGVLFDNLSLLIRKEVGLQWGVDKEMRRLANTLSTIRDVLEDAEENQLTNKAVVNWLKKLKDVAYDADNVLDLWATKALEMEQGVGRDDTTKQAFNHLLTCFCFEQIKFRRKTAIKIRELLEKFDGIADEKSKFHLTHGDVRREIKPLQNRETSSYVTEPILYGREKEKEYVLDLLLNGANSQKELSVCPILGMGGLGKTTLAQTVYNDEKVKSHFQLKIWVCVSDDFDLKRLTKVILDSVTGRKSDVTELDPLQHLLQAELTGKRFLIILDDVWNENQEQWMRLRGSLGCGSKGSSILVTTRLQTVASITGTFPPCSLNYLSDVDCWSLFKQCAFGIGNEESLNLVKIGKEIVKKCGGVPLAAKVLGGLMRFKVEESEWRLVRDSKIWDLPQSEENTILPALMLSYAHLSSVMRQCFAYCSIFPKDYPMKKKQVINLWMANGLIQSKEGLHEEIGIETFNALSYRSFFQVAKKHKNGDVKCVTMHDLIHDLACSITVHECYRIDEDEQIVNTLEGTRHLSITKRPVSSVKSFDKLAPKLRTFLAFQKPDLANLKFSLFVCIRAMSFEDCELTVVPESFGDLKHLRYLNLSGTQIRWLPESICELRNLETLDLRHCSDLERLPKYLAKIISLRHLHITGLWKIEEMPIGMGQLTCLRTLRFFIVGSDEGRHIKELKGLDHLSGKVVIRELEHVKSSTDAMECNLMRKKDIQKLQLAWSDSHLGNGIDREVIEELQPHPNMKELVIKNYQSLSFPSWLDVLSLPNLVKIWISHAKCEQLPSLGKLPSLKSLTITGMPNVTFFLNSDYNENGFLSLEELSLYTMHALEGWSSSSSTSGNTGGGEEEQVVVFPSLKIFWMADCPNLKTLPFPASLHCSGGRNLPLRFLWVEECPKLDFTTVNFQHLTALEELHISKHSGLTSLPEGMQHLSSTLEGLTFAKLPALVFLPDWIERFTRLRRLTIRKCKNFRMLPEGLRHLTSLKYFNIYYCHPDLRTRCAKDTGEDWHKIAHIPRFGIDNELLHAGD